MAEEINIVGHKFREGEVPPIETRSIPVTSWNFAVGDVKVVGKDEREIAIYLIDMGFPKPFAFVMSPTEFNALVEIFIDARDAFVKGRDEEINNETKP